MHDHLLAQGCIRLNLLSHRLCTQEDQSARNMLQKALKAPCVERGSLKEEEQFASSIAMITDVPIRHLAGTFAPSGKEF